MADYILSLNQRFAYNPIYDTIELGFCGREIKNLTDNELIEYVADVLTHEHIHKAINKIFHNETLTKLFDSIEYLFRNEKLHRKAIKNTSRETYQQVIGKYGFKFFLSYYGLKTSDIDFCSYIASIRNDKKEVMV